MSEPHLAAAFEAQRDMLWGLAYRMTGVAADADDVVQETFLRALERPPPDTTRELAPWLTRVAMNLARDRLRKRKRALETYVGPWLPEPAREAGFEALGVSGLITRESASFAYLLALEVLTPLQRGVLVLREVLDLSTRETAAALETTEASVRTTLHRARQALAKARGASEAGDPAARIDRHRAAMAGLMRALATQDLEAVQAALAADVKVTTDAGGEFAAATRVLTGADRAAAFLLGVMAKRKGVACVSEVRVNGGVGYYFESDVGHARHAPRQLLTLEADGRSRPTRLWVVLSSAKLDRLAAGLAAGA